MRYKLHLLASGLILLGSICSASSLVFTKYSHFLGSNDNRFVSFCIR
jgi:hypothetical protein